MPRTTISVVGLILGVTTLLHVADARAQTSNPHTEWGLKFFHNLEYKRALEAFKQAREWKGNTPQDLAKIFIYEGITQCELMSMKKGRQSFRQALEHDPSVQLPKSTSPKIQALFKKVKSEKEKEKPAPPTSAPTQPVPEPPAAAGTTQPAPSTAAPAAPDTRPEADEPPYTLHEPTVEKSPDSGTRSNWPSWLSLGVGVAAGTTAIALGAISRDADEKSNDKTLSWDEAMDQHDRASSLALSANVLFAVAGAAMITSGILFLLNRPSNADRTSAAVVPTRSGVVIGVTGRAW
jgi:hypothetical protein